MVEMRWTILGLVLDVVCEPSEALLQNTFSRWGVEGYRPPYNRQVGRSSDCFPHSRRSIYPPLFPLMLSDPHRLFQARASSAFLPAIASKRHFQMSATCRTLISSHHAIHSRRKNRYQLTLMRPPKLSDRTGRSYRHAFQSNRRTRLRIY